MSLRGGRELARLDRRAVGFALSTAVTICAYSLVDGIGARLAGSAHAYSAALFVAVELLGFTHGALQSECCTGPGRAACSWSSYRR
jgi:hypothetical protein